MTLDISDEVPAFMMLDINEAVPDILAVALPLIIEIYWI
jgi:hypothetical protein